MMWLPVAGDKVYGVDVPEEGAIVAFYMGGRREQVYLNKLDGSGLGRRDIVDLSPVPVGT